METANIPDDDGLPPVTITQQGALWNVILHFPNRPSGTSYHMSLTLEGALNAATHYLYNYVEAGYQPPPHHPLYDLPPNRRRASLTRKERWHAIKLSDMAWEQIQKQTHKYAYNGRSYTTGSSHYLSALLRANPTSDPVKYWSDTRPEDLIEYDEARLRDGKFPFWSASIYREDGSQRTARLLNRNLWDKLLAPHLLLLANHFIIGPARGNALSTNARAAAALEAIGLQYLTPHNPPPPNPNPIKSRGQRGFDYHNYKKWEFTF